MATDTATLGGGCFWCLEAVFERLAGVVSVTSGYAGGHTPNPSYDSVCAGVTGHAEVVQVEFDPQVVSYRELLEVFFAIHDPTTPDRQGNDVGTQYRSAVYYRSEQQRTEAQDLVAELERAGSWSFPVVTEIEPLDAFYAAEPYHQGYYGRHAEEPYCRLVIDPKIAKLRQRFAARLAGRGGDATAQS